jgi:hypothetical protein
MFNAPYILESHGKKPPHSGRSNRLQVAGVGGWADDNQFDLIDAELPGLNHAVTQKPKAHELYGGSYSQSSNGMLPLQLRNSSAPMLSQEQSV